MKPYEIQPAERGSVLILLPNGGFDALQLNFTRHGSKVFCARNFAGSRIEGMQKTNRKSAAGTHTCSCGNVRKTRYLHAAFDAHKVQALAHQGMLDFRNV